MHTVKFTQYETISIGYALTDPDQIPLPLPDLIEADVCTIGGNRILRLDVIRVDPQNGKFTLTTSQALPAGNYLVNVFLTNAGVRSASPAFRLNIEHSPTKPAYFDNVEIDE